MTPNALPKQQQSPMTTRKTSGILKRTLPVSKSPSKRTKVRKVLDGPCIVGETGTYFIIKLRVATSAVLKKPVGAHLKNIGVECRACEWMTKELKSTFFNNSTTPSQVVAVMSIRPGSLAENAGFHRKDLIAYPKNGNWKLLNWDEVKDSYIDIFFDRSSVNMFVARKLSAYEIPKYAYTMELPKNISPKLVDARPGWKDPSPDATFSSDNPVVMYKPQTKSGAGTGVEPYSCGPKKVSKLSEEDERAVQALLSIPTGRKRAPIPVPPPKKKIETLTRNEVGEDDVVLSCGGYDRGMYRKTIVEWWERYEMATHTLKRDVCHQAVRDMITRGVRFLIKIEDGSKNGCFVVEPEGSARIANKVLRALRAEVISRTEHLDAEQMKQRNIRVQKIRNEARRRYRPDYPQLHSPDLSSASKAAPSEHAPSLAPATAVSPNP